AGCNKEADQPAKAQKTTTDGQPPAKKNGPITEPEPKTKPSGKPEFTMTAAQLAKEYAADKAAFDKKYVDKLVELEGVVEDPNLGPVGGSRPRVTLDGDKPPQFVDCRFKPANKNKLAKLTKGQKIKIVGTCQASFASVVLDDCDLLETGKDVSQAISAAQLTEELRKDKSGTEAKYKGKQLIVEGV